MLMLVSLACATTMIGCKSDDAANNSNNKTMMSAGFNEETYIWESFLFPTNRTSGKQ